MDTPTLLPDLLRYTCSRCEHSWDAVLTEEYGACDDDCGECGARHMSPVVVDTNALTRAAPLLLSVCEKLKAVWDAGDESNEIEWEDLSVAVDMAAEAISMVTPP